MQVRTPTTPTRARRLPAILRKASGQNQNSYFAEEERAPRASWLTWLIGAGLLTFVVWACLFQLDEVSTGTGKVIPYSREQVIQSLEGGILESLAVKEGDVVQGSQVLAQLSRTRTESAVDESASRARAALATAARLRAEVDGGPLVFPREVTQDPALVKSETALYQSRREGLQRSLASIHQSLALVRKELQITEKLATQGASSDVEVLRLKRQASDLEMRASDTRDQYYVKAREELARANSEVEAQSSVTRGRADALSRLTVRSPVKGVVKDIEVNTVGGVIPPNGRLMAIVPMGDQLVVEARVSPRDVAFIHPGQKAIVKITAYDYAIFGGMDGKVTSISPDTIQDDVRKDQYYYRVFVRTDTDTLKNKQGKAFPIVPGMVATVDIHTGEKTVWHYLTKPLNRAREALRER